MHIKTVIISIYYYAYSNIRIIIRKKQRERLKNMKHLFAIIFLSLLTLSPAHAYSFTNASPNATQAQKTQQVYASPSATQAQKAQQVYASPKGKRYHYMDCRTLSRSKNILPMSIKKAKQSGRTPCKVCSPALAYLKDRSHASSTPIAINKHIQQQSNSKSISTLSTTSPAWQGICIGVSDGDTITVLKDGKTPIKIRLYGIDTPEKKQAFGKKAHLYTSQLVFHKKIKVQTIDIDRYNREVAIITLPDTSLLQTKILENGMAWVYTKYCKLEFRPQWQKIEKKSQNHKIGLWQDKDAVAPWQWRKEKRENTKRMKIQKNAKSEEIKNLAQHHQAQYHQAQYHGFYSKFALNISNKNTQASQAANL